jgi:mannose-6-phosphate isomerase-like protein (cupin superfamily)
MPVLVDSSLWVHQLRKSGDPAKRDRVNALLESGEAAWCPPVRLELWRGVTNGAERKTLRRYDALLPDYEISDASFDRSDYVIKINQMSSFYDKPGEFGYAIHGEDYGFDRLSFVLTETQPNGGPPLHTHTVEEGHVVLSGRVTYVIGERQVTAEGPYIARVPAGVPHTFINSGTAPVNVVATFPSRRRDYTEVGPNPLVKRE